MYVKDVMVQNQVGLHARPATFFIQRANEFRSSIWVEKEERRVNARAFLVFFHLVSLVEQLSELWLMVLMKKLLLKVL